MTGFKPLKCFAGRLQCIPAAAAMASYRRSRLPFDRLQTPKMLRRPFAMLRRPVAPSPVAVSPCSSVAPAGKSHHKATAMAPAIPAAAAIASYRRSRLPFDRLQTPKMLRRPFAMVRRPVVPSPVAVSPCCSSLKASPRPQQWLLIGVRGCRLTGFKPGPLQCSAGRLRQAL